MKFKFILARHKIHPKVKKFHTQWYLLLDDIETFTEFFEQRASDLSKAYTNMKKNMKVIQLVKSGHLTNRDESFIHNILSLDQTRKTIIDDCRILDGMLLGYKYMFNRIGKIVVSSNNSFRQMDETFQILDTREAEGIVFPATSEKDIHVSKWPNGTHWYVRVGNYDLPTKYVTHKDGFEAGKRLLKGSK